MCTSEGGGFDQVVGVILTCPCDGIGEDEAALCVRVQDFGGCAAVMRDHIARAVRVAAGHVLCHGDGSGHLDIELQSSRSNDGGKDGCGATHIGNHLVHVGRWFDGHSTRVESDALAHQSHSGCIVQLLRGVADAHKARAACGTLTHCYNAAEALLGQRGVVKHLHGEAIVLSS